MLFREFAGYHSLSRLFKFISEIKIKETSFSKQRIFTIRSSSLRGGLLLVLSDFWEMDPSSEDVLFFKALADDVTFVHILSPQECQPVLSGRIRFFDLETKGFCDRFITNEELQKYEKLLEEHIQLWKKLSHRYEIRYIFLRSDLALEEAILVHARRAGLLR
jgi:hypothetical protein